MSQTNGRKFSSIQFCLSIVAVLPARIEAESRNSFISRSVLAKDQHGQIQVYTENSALSHGFIDRHQRRN
jgi:hypothetical protein